MYYMVNKYLTRLCIYVYFKTPHKVCMNFSVNPLEKYSCFEGPSKNLIHSGGGGGGVDIKWKGPMAFSMTIFLWSRWVPWVSLNASPKRHCLTTLTIEADILINWCNSTMTPNVDFSLHARVRVFLAPILLSCICYAGYVDLWTKEVSFSEAVDLWTCGLRSVNLWGCELVDSVDSVDLWTFKPVDLWTLWTCGPVDSVVLWILWTCGPVDSVNLWTCRPVDSVDLRTLWTCGLCGHVDSMDLWTLWTCGPVDSVDLCTSGNRLTHGLNCCLVYLV